ncbi:MAG TPA: helix-turn-helix domain-containing protein [Chloroflexota bacterium]|nr:helix-turn-helix domain-containing protein [Chloroflexota bacterium]
MSVDINHQPSTINRGGPAGRRDKRSAILRAAVRLFARGEFHGTNVPRLAREAGVADGTIYNYFQNKEDLARQALLAASAQIERDLLAGVPQQAPPLERLELAALVLLQIAEDDLERARFVMCVDHAAYLGEPAPSGLVAPLALLIAGAAARGEAKPLAPELLARLWLGVVGAAVDARASGRLERPLPEVAEAVARAALDAVRRV